MVFVLLLPNIYVLLIHQRFYINRIARNNKSYYYELHHEDNFCLPELLYCVVVIGLRHDAFV